MQCVIAHSVNANTWETDKRAWDMWELICEGYETSPLRTAAEARAYPERNAHLLAALMLHAFAVGVPRDKSRKFIKPWLAQSGECAVHGFTCTSRSSSTPSRPSRERARSESQDCQPSMGPNALVGEGTYSRWSAAVVDV